jgi:SAM-dependent methyltransferase
VVRRSAERDLPGAGYLANGIRIGTGVSEQHEDNRPAAGHDEIASIYRAEAEFGYRHVQPMLAALVPGSRVLEVGSGAGLLLRRCAQAFPEMSFTGLEPMGEGFGFMDGHLDAEAPAENAVIHTVGYEAFKTPQRYDLIFLVNVFEHLPDWKDFMAFVRDALNEGGRCLVLCPNHAFPYEPHFRVPVIFSKQLTARVFAGKIREFERYYDCAGLWQSLNLVTLRQVLRHGRTVGLKVESDPSVIVDLVARVGADGAFKKRQGLLASPARLLYKLGVLPPLVKTGFVAARLPYMKLILSRAD